MVIVLFVLSATSVSYILFAGLLTGQLEQFSDGYYNIVVEEYLKNLHIFFEENWISYMNKLKIFSRISLSVFRELFLL